MPLPLLYDIVYSENLLVFYGVYHIYLSEFKKFVYQNDLRSGLNVRYNNLKREQTMTQNKFPPGWDENRAQSIIIHYEQQTEDETVDEDEAAFQDKSSTLMAIPTELVPAVLDMKQKKVTYHVN